jgi:hypothetical protein
MGLASGLGIYIRNRDEDRIAAIQAQQLSILWTQATAHLYLRKHLSELRMAVAERRTIPSTLEYVSGLEHTTISSSLGYVL